MLDDGDEDMTVRRVNILKNIAVRKKFIQGVKLLKGDSLRPGWPSTYDIFVIWHVSAMMTLTPSNGTGGGRNAAHSGPVFLPWHRWMLLVFEYHLQRVLGDNKFGLPYWDWAQDGELTESQQIKAPIWKSYCMGGSGNPVTSGPFAKGSWTVNFRQILTQEGLVLAPTKSSLTRSIGTKVDDNNQKTSLPTRADVKSVIKRKQLNVLYDNPPWNEESSGFRNELEGWLNAPPAMMHNAVHVWVGGDMALGSSPNDPVFFLNHANVDRMWQGWQKIHSQSPYLPDVNENPDLQPHRLNDFMYEISKDELFDPIFKGQVRPIDVIDVSNRYAYDTFKDINR